MIIGAHSITDMTALEAMKIGFIRARLAARLTGAAGPAAGLLDRLACPC
jgi:hypothetical protein